MFKQIHDRARAFNRRAGKAIVALPLALLMMLLAMPMTASCQRGHTDSERGISELRSLVASASGKPSASDLAAIESKHAGTRASALARFLRGYLYYTAQNYQAAADALDVKAISAHSALGDYASFFRAESEAASGANSQALRDFGIVYTTYPDSLKARESRLRASEMAVRLGDPDSAIKELRAMADAGDADAVYNTAQALESKARNDEAVRLYRRIYYELPATAAAERARGRLAALGAAVENNPVSFETERARITALYDAKQYWSAARAFDELVVKFPEAGRDDLVQLQHGISLLNSKQPAQAVAPLARVSSRNADAHAQALFYQAEALRKSNRAPESSTLVDRLVSQYPKSRWAEQALYDLASFYDKQSSAVAATRYRQLLAAYPKSQYAPEASYKLGWQAYRSKNYAEAARLLEQHLASYRSPETKFIGEAGFWAGKSEEMLGNRARALALYDLVVERYRYGYHGYLSKLRADRLRASDPALRPEPQKNGWDIERMRRNALHVEKVEETADGSEANRIARADDLEVIGIDDLFLKEINTAIEGAPASPRLNLRLAQFYSRRGENFQATLILRRGYPDIYSYKDSDVPREAWDIFFPMIHWQTIKQEAQRHGIDPHIAAGLIRQESVFNPKAISRVGARGLMQLMPATGQLVAKQQGAGRITTADLYNPTLNIKLGMSYLAQMLGQFGRIEYAAAGYNAGPGRAKQWKAERGHLDIEDWIESIPFTETRGYVQGVLRYAANYRRFYK